MVKISCSGDQFVSGFLETFSACKSAAAHRTSGYSQNVCSYLHGRSWWHVLDCLSFLCELIEIWQSRGVPLGNNYIYVWKQKLESLLVLGLLERDRHTAIQNKKM